MTTFGTHRGKTVTDVNEKQLKCGLFHITIEHIQHLIIRLLCTQNNCRHSHYYTHYSCHIVQKRVLHPIKHVWHLTDVPCNAGLDEQM